MRRLVFISSVLFFATLCLSTPSPALTVTANSTLQRGTQISASDLIIKDAGDIPNADILAEYVGKELSRTVYNGTPIRQKDVKEPVMVRRNSRVNMIYRAGRLEITAVGRALQEGALGDMVTVINLDSRKKVDGIVTARGTVEMNP